MIILREVEGDLKLFCLVIEWVLFWKFVMDLFVMIVSFVKYYRNE